MKSVSRRTVLARVGWLLAEMLVVFAGVYAAFLLEQHRAERRAETRRQQAYATLHEALSEVDGGLEQSIPVVDSLYVAPFFSAYEAGQMPPLRPFDFRANRNDDMWQVMLQTGALDAFDIEFIQDVDRYFQGLEYMERRFARAQALNDELLLPNLGSGAAAFYDPATQRLRPKYRWYPEMLREMIALARHRSAETDTLLAQLEGRMEE